MLRAVSKTMDLQSMTEEYLIFGHRLEQHIADTAAMAWAMLEDERNVLFEGAQGALLDIDHGTYPYVTSSNTVAGQAAAGSGLGPSSIGYVLGIAKAYTTRVGSGPFPTEQENEVGEYIGQRGRGAAAAAAGLTRPCSSAAHRSMV